MDGHCLSQEQIRDLAEGTPIRVIWNGGITGEYKVKHIDADSVVAIHIDAETVSYFDAVWSAQEVNAGIKVPRAWVELLS
jgi:preprotein translocase subunit YajC